MRIGCASASSLVLLLLAALVAAAGVAPPPVADFTEFESRVLPRWLADFEVLGPGGQPVPGAFRQKVGGPPAPYGTADITHLLYTVNQLNLTGRERDAWAAVLSSYQNLTLVCNSRNSYPGMGACPGLPPDSSWPYFYTLEGSTGGWEPWHSSGDITASFRLLDRFPPHPNPMYELIASNASLWEPTFAPIVYGGIHKIIGILGTLLMSAPGARERYAPFLDWFVRYINEHEQQSTGFLCNVSPADKAALGSCIAPTFASNMVKHVGIGTGWPNNRTAQRTILGLQLPTGFWGGAPPGYHEIDSLYIAVRTLPWNPDRRAEVRGACARYLRAASTFGPGGPGTGRGLNDPDVVLREYKNAHDLAAPVYAIAVCAEEFPSLVKTLRPWRFSGDKAPFI